MPGSARRTPASAARDFGWWSGASSASSRSAVEEIAGLPERVSTSELNERNPARREGLSEAADGTRTHDLLHGKQCREVPNSTIYAGFMPGQMRSDCIRLPWVLVPRRYPRLC